MDLTEATNASTLSRVRAHTQHTNMRERNFGEMLSDWHRHCVRFGLRTLLTAEAWYVIVFGRQFVYYLCRVIVPIIFRHTFLNNETQ